VFDPRELALLTQAVRIVDRLDALAEAVDRDGVMVATVAGEKRIRRSWRRVSRPLRWRGCSPRCGCLVPEMNRRPDRGGVAVSFGDPTGGRRRVCGSAGWAVIGWPSTTAVVTVYIVRAWLGE
jgi:hypothetical protein